MLSKTDFLTFLESPMHLWAKAHDQLEAHPPSAYEQYLSQQGQAVEALAEEYLEQVILTQAEHLHLNWQPAFDDGRYQIRADALIWDENTGVYDLYEIKSATSAQKTHVYDVTFQVLLLESILPLRHVYLLHIDNTYRRGEQLELDRFFVAEDISERVTQYRDEVDRLRHAAREVTHMAVPKPEFACTKPKSCPCPALCHPALPENPIYNLPYLGKKAASLRELGILAIKDIPPTHNLSSRQRLHYDAVCSGQPILDIQAIKASLGQLQYPLCFLDYETFNPAIPLFTGYQPYEHIVFQYSAFMIDEPGAEPKHYEALITDGSDPAPQIVPHLLENIGHAASAVVWNKGFEAGRNQDLAQHCPQSAQQLLSINERLYDLMLIFRDGLFVHPHFQGSASLKAVLPVLCPDLQYGDLAIQDGEAAMLTWYQLHSGAIPPGEHQETIAAMKAYCKMDTYGMVAIWEKLGKL